MLINESGHIKHEIQLSQPRRSSALHIGRFKCRPKRSADNKPPQILSFGLHFPASDAQTTKRAAQLVSVINH
jgi:hypothetical protein